MYIHSRERGLVPRQRIYCKKNADGRLASDFFVQTRYSNPLITENAPDQCILTTEEQLLYTTQGYDTDGRWHNIQRFKAKNYIDWLRYSDALPHGAPWAEDGNYWAPDVIKLCNKYVMYFCGKTKGGGHAIGVAVCDTADGDFISLDEPLITGDPTFADIDPRVQINQVHGYVELLWGSAGKPIKKVRLSDDGLSIYPGAEIIKLKYANRKKPLQSLLEAPEEITHIDAKTLKKVQSLLVSGENTFGKTKEKVFGKSYAVLAFAYNSFLQYYDTFIRYILQDNTANGMVNPGHHYTFTDARGNYWIAYLYIDLNDVTDSRGEVVRKVGLEPLYFDKKQRPYTKYGMPTKKPQLGPAKLYVRH